MKGSVRSHSLPDVSQLFILTRRTIMRLLSRKNGRVVGLTASIVQMLRIAVKTLLRSNIDPHRLGIRKADAKTVTIIFTVKSTQILLKIFMTDGFFLPRFSGTIFNHQSEPRISHIPAAHKPIQGGWDDLRAKFQQILLLSI